MDSQSEQLCGLKNPQADVSFGESAKGTLSDQNQTSPVHGASGVLPDEHGTSDQRASLNPASMPDSTGSWNGNMPPTIPEQSTQKNSRDHDYQPHKKAKRQPADKVVLTPETVKLIRGYHNSAVGHMGINQTMSRLQVAYKTGVLFQLPTKAEVRKFIQFCAICQKVRATKKDDAPPPLGKLQCSKPFQELSLDVFGPLIPSAITGFTYCIVAVDGFSRFVFAEAIPDTTAESAARFVHKLSGTFGYPAAFRYDNCSQFDNHLLKALLNLAGSDQHSSIPFAPQSNSMVERSIKEIIRHLRCIVNDRRNHDQWDLMIPIALRIINSTNHASIGRSPAGILLPGFALDQYMYPELDKTPPAVALGLDRISDARHKDIVQKWITHLQAL